MKARASLSASARRVFAAGMARCSSKSMQGLPVLALSAAVVLNAVLILLGRGSFLVMFLVLCSSVYAGAPLFLLSVLVFLLAAFKKNSKLRSMAVQGITAALVILSTLLSIPLGNKVLAYDLRTAQSFCEELMPRLEEIRSRTGSYPKELAVLLKGKSLPWLLDSRFYQSDGASYRLLIYNPGIFLGGGLVYNSEEKKWQHWD